MKHNGLLVVDKPAGITSRDAVDRAALWFPRKTKIGHAGTLDPLATGVLVLAIGQATRLIEYVQAMRKVYRTRIVLGATSDTDDADGTITSAPNASPVSEAGVRSALAQFLGEIEQVPPSYSAAHVAGQRAYALARRGEEVSLSARRVRIDGIDVLSYAWPVLELEVRCGKGTYIRSIARDLGHALGVGGHIATLRRLRIGSFAVEDASALDAEMTTALAKLLPLATAVSELPSLQATQKEIHRLRRGQRIPKAGAGEVAVVDEAGDLIAVGQVKNGLLHPEKVIP